MRLDFLLSTFFAAALMTFSVSSFGQDNTEKTQLVGFKPGEIIKADDLNEIVRRINSLSNGEFYVADPRYKSKDEGDHGHHTFLEPNPSTTATDYVKYDVPGSYLSCSLSGFDFGIINSTPTDNSCELNESKGKWTLKVLKGNDYTGCKIRCFGKNFYGLQSQN